MSEKGLSKVIKLRSKNFRNIILYWFPLIGYAAIIFLFSSLSFSIKEPEVPYLDKVFHLGEYAVFGLLLLRAITKSFPHINIIKCCFLTMIFSCLYGVSDEVHQLFIAGREFSIYDIFADTLGGSLGAFFYKMRFT